MLSIGRLRSALPRLIWINLAPGPDMKIPVRAENSTPYRDSKRPADRGIQILPLRWVFTYKFDSNGFLTKLKARICVRGDLQEMDHENKTVATLAARTAKAIFAIAAAFA
ncbi:hypothetical protein N7478_012185 [Penicillium angulare]|uniref:uncharacterized protein n=1 Tax=Penicillium angulare TaxID=116970 RepID=UPI002540B310|nr:uncharacterized protein N7478_012185 [Penicillium angulare]KAJ5260580.1 hypothetical protein N7478_012185 [Penicillium angulare]